MKFKLTSYQSNQAGFTHGIVLMAVVLLFAIAGVGFLVLSHADSSLPAPTNVKLSSTSANTGSKGVLVDWDDNASKSPDFAYYAVRRSTTTTDTTKTGWTRLPGNLTVSQTVDTTAVPGTKYNYYVLAFNKSTVPGAHSQVVTITAGSTATPPPTNPVPTDPGTTNPGPVGNRPKPVFDGANLPADLSSKKSAPYASYQSSALASHRYIPQGETVDSSAGLSRVTIPGEAGYFADFWTNDNGHYGINSADTPQANATVRSQARTANSPGGTFDPGATSWIVSRGNDTVPAATIRIPKVIGGTLAGKTNSSAFASHGVLSVYGQPFIGSSGNSLSPHGRTFFTCTGQNRTLTKPAYADWHPADPPGINETSNIAWHIRWSSKRGANDATAEVFYSKGHNPLVRQKITLSNGTKVDKLTGFCTLNDSNYTGPQSLGVGNYHRYGMFTGITHVRVQARIYRDADVSNINQIDPYYGL